MSDSPPGFSSFLLGYDWTSPVHHNAAQRAAIFRTSRMGDYNYLECQMDPVGDQGYTISSIFAIPQNVQAEFLGPSARESTSLIVGEDARQWLQNLSASIPTKPNYDAEGVMGFGDTIATDFYGGTSTSDPIHKYRLLYDSYALFGVKWLTDASTDNMTTTAKADFLGTSKMKGADLVKKYGTHWMVSATIGGMKGYARVGQYCDPDRAAQLTAATFKVVAEMRPDLTDVPCRTTPPSDPNLSDNDYAKLKAKMVFPGADGSFSVGGKTNYPDGLSAE